MARNPLVLILVCEYTCNNDRPSRFEGFTLANTQFSHT